MPVDSDTADTDGRRPSFRHLLFCPIAVRRALKVSGIVGTLLIMINQGDLLLTGGWPPLWKIILTYLVPYGVSSYSTAALLRETGEPIE
ncbi:MAG: nitrate/nitrite transporter NrtS [Pseudomonadota bacterium]